MAGTLLVDGGEREGKQGGMRQKSSVIKAELLCEL